MYKVSWLNDNYILKCYYHFLVASWADRWRCANFEYWHRKCLRGREDLHGDAGEVVRYLYCSAAGKNLQGSTDNFYLQAVWEICRQTGLIGKLPKLPIPLKTSNFILWACFSRLVECTAWMELSLSRDGGKIGGANKDWSRPFAGLTTLLKFPLQKRLFKLAYNRVHKITVLMHHYRVDDNNWYMAPQTYWESFNWTSWDVEIVAAIMNKYMGLVIHNVYTWCKKHCIKRLNINNCLCIVYMVYLYTMCTYLFPIIIVDLDIEHYY